LVVALRLVAYMGVRSTGRLARLIKDPSSTCATKDGTQLVVLAFPRGMRPSRKPLNATVLMPDGVEVSVAAFSTCVS
jgi:hypothetical protein